MQKIEIFAIIIERQHFADKRPIDLYETAVASIYASCKVAALYKYISMRMIWPSQRWYSYFYMKSGSVNSRKDRV